MKNSDLREMTDDELQQKRLELRQALFNLKFQHVTGQLENTAQLVKTRREIARISTILREKGQQTAA